MRADCHLHTHFSGDSDASPEEHILTALKRGIGILTFTDHFDADYTYDDCDFDLRKTTGDYLNCVRELSEKYKDRIDIRFGVELGLMTHLNDLYTDYLENWPFDFCIGSTHLVDGIDPFFPSFWEVRSVKESLVRFYEVSLDNIKAVPCFDSFGHLDYICRYIPKEGEGGILRSQTDENGSLLLASDHDLTDLTDEIFKWLIEHGKALEVNSAGYAKGLMQPNPGKTLLLRYRELGGELVTTGSDAHFSDLTGQFFDETYALIKSCGFDHIAVYKNRKPEMLSI